MDPHQYTAGQDIDFEYAPVASTAQKKRRKKKKKPAITLHADGQGVTINNISSAAALRGAASAAADNIWNTTATEERMRVRAFWLSLTDAERLDLVQLDKEVLLEKIRKQRHPCGCSVCGRKRVAIEQELEALYKAYYAEIEAFGGRQHDILLNDQPPEPQEEDSEYSDYYEQYDEIGGGILSVADDLLKNDGRRFVDVMEHLATQRIQREVPIDHCDEYDEDFVDDSLLDEDQQLENEQRLVDGRRMLQIFAARMFEQRVLNAYREHVARERQQQLLLEIEEEDQAQSLKEQKKQKEKEKKKDKKRQQRQQREEAERKKAEELELQKQEKERQQQEKVRKQQLEEEKRKAELHRQEIEARMKRLELEEKQARELKQGARKDTSNTKPKEPKLKEVRVDAKSDAKGKQKPTTAIETNKQVKASVSTPDCVHRGEAAFGSSPRSLSAQSQSQVLPPAQITKSHGNTPLQTPTHSRGIGQILPPLPNKSLGPAAGLDQSLYREPVRSISQPLPSTSSPTSNTIGSPLSLPRLHTPISQQPPAAQVASGLSVDRTRPWSLGTNQQQPAPYRQDFSTARTSGPLYGWNQWSVPAAPAHQPTQTTPPATLWSKNSLWSNTTSRDAIRQASISCYDRLVSEGMAVDGFVAASVLYHATVDVLGNTPISLNDLFEACDINSGHSNVFECRRDHVGLVTHVRHVQK